MIISISRAIPRKLSAASFALAGIFLFAGFIHGNTVQFAIAVSGLVLAAAMICFSAKDLPSLLSCLGLSSFTSKAFYFSLAGLGMGISLSLIYRICSNLSLFPATLTGIAWVVPLVGITEELFFRGYLQGVVSSHSTLVSIVIAALGHTLYKYLVLKSLRSPMAFDFPVLLILTLGAGLLFGLSRALSKSTIPPLIAHGIFDVLVYGGLSSWPIWVWS